MTFPIPPNETGRLAALRELEVLDTAPEQLYDDVVALASAICRTPIAIINFVDAERQWGKALVGLESSEAPREASFCARTIVTDSGLLVVPDTLEDPVFAENPQVVGEPGLRFYAGAAITTRSGYALGSVCVADRRPRELDDEQLRALEVLARRTAALLDLRRRSIQLAQLNGELRHMAVSDPLTGLANRTLLFDRLSHALRHHERTGRPLGVVFCDLDGFKQVNDGLGHRAGDDVLRLVAARLADAGRGSDTVARIAGDEFVVVCTELAQPEDLDLVAQRLAAAVGRPAEIAGAVCAPRISVGAALAESGDDADTLLARADAEMYRAKRAAALPAAV